MVEKISRDAESQKNAVNEMRASMDRMCVEAQVAAEQIARYKRDNSLLMNQVSELQSRTQRKEFEASINVDIESQVRKMNAIGDLIKNKLTQLESFSGNSDSSKTESESTLKTLIDAISGELSTEIGFAGHLSQLVDKLNKRRADQDSAIADVEKRLRDAEARVLAQETERVELTGRLVRLQAELSTREQSNSASGESVRALQEALNAKQQRLDQHKTHCSELKAALDQCRAGMNSMRKNEEAIRRHVSAQDEEIRNLRSQTEGGTNDRNRLARQVGELTGELSIRSEELLRRTDEVKRHSKEAQEAQRALEKLTSIFKQKEVRVKELEEGLLKRRREKDMLMVTYCRVIKENERLSAELKSHASSDNAATNDGASIQAALQVRAQFQQQEIERLRGQISALESKNQETLQQLSDAIKSKDLSEEELRERSRELSQARAVINTLEKSKKELASQTARFGQQAAELRSHVRRLEGERTEVTRKLNAQITAQGPINNEIDLLRSQLAEAEKFRNLGEAALRKEKENIQRLESKSREERRLRIERENALQSLEAGRARLTRQIDILNREHEKAVSFIQKNSLKQYNDADKDELDENISKDANRKDFNATSRDHDANLDDWVPFDDQSHNYGVPSSAYAVDKNKNAIGSTIVDEYHSESEFDGTSKFIPVGTNFDSASDFKRGVRNEFSQIDRGEVIRSKNKASSQDINMTTNLFRSDNFDDDRKTIFRGVEETRNSYYVPSDVHQTPNYRPTPSYTHDRRPLGNYSPSRNGTEPFSIDLANDLENDDERINSLNSEYIEKTNFDDGDGDDDDGDRRWLPQSESTDRLRLQNQTIRRQIAEIREEIKEGNMTPLRTNSRVDFGNEESSIMSESSLTIDDDDQRDDNSLNGTEDSFSTLANNFLNKNGSDVNAEMKRRLEKENRLLNRIVGKVRAELMRATVETPGSSSSSATS